MDVLYRERQELKIVLNILESITSSLDFHAVMYEIASRIAETVDAVRCSILLVEQKDAEHVFVVAANDDRKLKMLPVDLAKYPEVQAAIRRKQAVIIEDVEKSEMMRPYLKELRRLHFQSLLVLPILYQETVVGTLFLRAARKRSFTDQELKFCRVVASAAASAIKNSMLYRPWRKRSGSRRRRARESAPSSTTPRTSSSTSTRRGPSGRPTGPWSASRAGAGRRFSPSRRELSSRAFPPWRSWPTTP